MGTEVAIFQSQPADLALIGDLTQARSWVPSFRLYDGSSGPCKEGKIPVGHFGLSKAKNDPIEDLGKKVLCVPLTVQGKAMRLDASNKIIAMSNDMTSPIFKEIKTLARQPGRNGNMVGPEILLYLPDYDKFGAYFLTNTTAQNRYDDIKAGLNKAIYLQSKPIKKDAYTWVGFDVTVTDLGYTLPDEETCRQTLERFRNCSIAAEDAGNEATQGNVI